MSVFSACVNREADDITRLRIFQSEWTTYPDKPVSVELVTTTVEPTDIPSLEPYGFKAVAWTKYSDDHGILHAITMCRKINE